MGKAEGHDQDWQSVHIDMLRFVELKLTLQVQRARHSDHCVTPIPTPRSGQIYDGAAGEDVRSGGLLVCRPLCASVQ